MLEQEHKTSWKNRRLGKDPLTKQHIVMDNLKRMVNFYFESYLKTK